MSQLCHVLEWDQLPSDLVGLEERIVAFLRLADGEPWDWQTLLHQCGEGKRNETAAAIQSALRRKLIIETLPQQEWKAAMPNG